MRRKASLRLTFVGLSGLLGSSAAFGASSVAVKDGNIVLLQDGRERQLTKSGKDAGPGLSPDGKWVAFTRVGNPASTGSQGDCKSGAQADELRRIRIGHHRAVGEEQHALRLR